MKLTHTRIVSPGLFGYLDPNDPSHLNTLPQAFEAGLEYGPDRPCLGHRPLVTKSPLKFADTYVWQSYAEIDVRRRAVGSALEKLFSDGTLDVGTGELQCVGVWAPNCPGALFLSCPGESAPVSKRSGGGLICSVVQNGRLSISRVMRTRR